VSERQKLIPVLILQRFCGLPLLLVLWLACGARAEQMRVAVFAPLVVGETNGVAGHAALWQSLVTTELSRQDLFAVVEREELSAAEREWVLSLAAGESGARGAARSSWLGADWLVIGQLAITNELATLSLKVLDASLGAIEATATESFALTNLETQARAFAGHLRPAALRWMARRDIHTLVSVLDFELRSHLERNRWRERAIARRLRGFLQPQPGVLVMERVQIEQLLAETRLRRGGLAKAGNADTNGWANLRHYRLVSGSLTETQPEGQPLTFRILIRLKDLADNLETQFEESIPVEKWDDGLARIEQRLWNEMAGGSGGVPTGDLRGQRLAEARTLYDKAVKLTGIFPSASAFEQQRPSGMLAYSDLRGMFSDAYSFMGAETSPERRAKTLQAVQYLKAALLLEDDNPRLTLLLAQVLADKHVNDRELAVELAEEVGWRWPEYRRQAWGFVYEHTSGETRQKWLQRLVEEFPDSDYPRVAEELKLEKFLAEHRNDEDRTALVDALRPHLDRAIARERGDHLGGWVKRLFDLTQIKPHDPFYSESRHELQPPENRARGTALLEEMIQKHPDKAFFLCHFWWLNWNYRTRSDTNALHWLKRAADAAPLQAEKWESWLTGDAVRMELARRLISSNQFAEAIPYLEKIGPGHREPEKNLLLGRCWFETGDYERALKLFRDLGPDHKEAAEWAEKCEQKLGLPPFRWPPKPFHAVTNDAKWISYHIELPRPMMTNRFPSGSIFQTPMRSPGIRTMAVDRDYVWLGLVSHDAWSDHYLARLENLPREKALALRQGGLIRWSRRTGETKTYTTADGLPHPWVGTLAVSSGRLWVGTFGGGLGALEVCTEEWTVWTETNGLPMNMVRSLAIEGDTLWVGMGLFDRGGVAKLSLRTLEWRSMMPIDFPARTNAPPFVFQSPNVPNSVKQALIVTDVPVTLVTTVASIANRLWCSVPAVPNRAHLFPNGTLICDLSTNGWYRAGADTPGSFVRLGERIWMSLGRAGLAHCDLRGGDWQRVTRADGLPFDPGAIGEWNGRLLIVGEGLAVLDPAAKQFVVHPFPTPGAAGLMAIQGDDLYVVRGNQILALALREPARTSAVK